MWCVMEKVIKISAKLVLLILGVVLLNVFDITFTRGIVNIGNITGMALAVVFILVVLLWKRVKQLLGFFWKRKAGKVFLISLMALFCIAFIGVIWISVLLYRGATDETMFSVGVSATDESAKNGNGDEDVKIESEPVLVVLGCQVRGTSPSLMLNERIDAAYDYLVQHPNAVCIVSGGIGPGEKISEAQCMYEHLVERGISADRIYQEDRSTTTAENMTFSKEILDREGLGNSIAITTNEFHEYRARRIAYKYGLQSIPVSAKTAGWLFPTYYVRELYAIPGYILKY